MTKTYQIKINQGKDSKALDIPQAGTKGQAVTVKAVSGARYQLIDPETGYGPENIRASRQGKDLKVSFEGSKTTDLVIEDYYKVSAETFNGLIGEAESGKFYEYIPENAAGMASVPMLADAGQVVGMALGGAEVAPAGAAVGVLAAGLFSPWLLGAGALGLAAAGGGGGGGSTATGTGTGTGGGTTSANNTNAKIQINSIDDGLTTTDKTTGSKDTGVGSGDFYTADNTLTYFGKVSGFTSNGDQVKLELKDKSGAVISTAYVTPDASGNWSWNDTANTRTDGNYSLAASIVDKAGKAVSTNNTSQIITVDTQSGQNTDPSNPSNVPSDDPNKAASVSIVSIDDLLSTTDKTTGSKDTGVSSKDFYTADNTLTYFGKVSGFTSNGDQVKLELKDTSGKLISTAYVTPDATGNWSWNDTANTRVDGNYSLVASIADKAGNSVNTTNANQLITVDTQSGQNTDPSNLSNLPSDDPNKAASVFISSIDDGLTTTDKTTGSKDTGISSKDFYTADNTLTYFGNVSGFTFNGDQVKLELKDSSGKLISTAYVTPGVSGNWSWNDTANTRVDGNYSLVASIADKAGNAVSTTPASQIITVDTQSGQNTDPSNLSNLPSDDPNKAASVFISSIDDGSTTTNKTTGSKDTGISSKDFYTADNTLTYFGKVSSFTSNGDLVKLELKDSSGKVINSTYVPPDSGGMWSWNDQSNQRIDGKYSLDATIVDKAGNSVNSNSGGLATQQITIDNMALVSGATAKFTPSPTISGKTPSILSLDFKSILEDGSFDLYLGGTSFHGDVKNGVISMQNKDFTKGNTLATLFTSDANVTGPSIHLDFTDLAGNTHTDMIDLNMNNYLISKTIDISFIS